MSVLFGYQNSQVTRDAPIIGGLLAVLPIIDIGPPISTGWAKKNGPFLKVYDSCI